MGAFSQWCFDVQNEHIGVDRASSLWTSFAPDVYSEIAELSERELSDLDELLKLPRVPAKLAYLRDDSSFRACGQRIHQAVSALVATRRGEPEAPYLFAEVLGDSDPEVGKWAESCWKAILEGKPPAPIRQVEAKLVSSTGDSATLEDFVLAEVKGPWKGLRPHPVYTATTLFNTEFGDTILRAWDSALAYLGEETAIDVNRAFTWWIDRPVAPLDGTSHGGMVAAMVVALLKNHGMDPNFIASASLSKKDPLRLVKVGHVREKTKAIVNLGRQYRFFVHSTNFDEARQGAGGSTNQINSGQLLSELIAVSETTYSMPLEVAEAEAKRVFPKNDELREAIERRVPLTLRVVGKDGVQSHEPSRNALRSYPRLLVEGEAGSGKSWLMQWMVADAWSRFQPDASGHIVDAENAWAVIHINAPNLSTWLASGDSLLSLAEGFATGDLSAKDLAIRMSEGRVAIAIDNVEALGQEDAWALVSRLNPFLQNEPNLRLFLAVRSGTEAADVLQRLNIQRATVMPLSPQQVREMILAAFDDESTLAEQALAAAEAIRLFDFADSPILVSLFLEVAKVDSRGMFGGVPTRHSIYDRFVRISIERLSRPDMRRDIFLQWMRHVAEHVAEQLAGKTLRDHFTPLEYRHAIHEVVKQMPADLGHYNADQIESALTACGLFVREEGAHPTVKFRHHTVAEYLAAGAASRVYQILLRRSESIARDHLKKMLMPSSNGNVLAFMPAFCPDPLRVLELILDETERSPTDRNILLSARILREVHAVAS